MLPAFHYDRPANLGEALRLLREPGARPLAGGTDLLGCLRDQVFTARRLVSLQSVPGLTGLEARPDGGVRIGAMTPLAALIPHPALRPFPALTQAAAAVGTPQLRQQGTVGGNLCQRSRCWYYRGPFDCLRKGGGTCYAADGRNDRHALFGGEGCVHVHPSDLAPAVVLLGATLHLDGPGGPRTLPANRFFVPPGEDFQREARLGEGEVLTAIDLPSPASGSRSLYRKVRARRTWDFALAGAALAWTVKDGVIQEAGVVLAGVAPVPWRCPAAEASLRGSAPSADTFARAAEAALAGAEPLTDNGYKQDLLRGLLVDGWEGLARG